jgi:hypothetical protein
MRRRRQTALPELAQWSVGDPKPHHRHGTRPADQNIAPLRRWIPNATPMPMSWSLLPARICCIASEGQATPAKRRPRGVPAMGRPALIVGVCLDVSQPLTPNDPSQYGRWADAGQGKQPYCVGHGLDVQDTAVHDTRCGDFPCPSRQPSRCIIPPRELATALLGAGRRPNARCRSSTRISQDPLALNTTADGVFGPASAGTTRASPARPRPMKMPLAAPDSSSPLPTLRSTHYIIRCPVHRYLRAQLGPSTSFYKYLHAQDTTHVPGGRPSRPTGLGGGVALVCRPSTASPPI